MHVFTCMCGLRSLRSPSNYAGRVVGHIVAVAVAGRSSTPLFFVEWTRIWTRTVGDGFGEQKKKKKRMCTCSVLG